MSEKGRRPESIELAIERASDGEAEAVASFFEILLECTLYVPKRFQKAPLSNAPIYPNEFLDILGIQDGERVVVPVFTRENFVHDWSGQDFIVRSLRASDLFELMPDGWWIDLNPGSDVGKELSAWEVSELKLGREAIPSLVQELVADEVSQPIEIEFMSDQNKLPWMDVIVEFATSKEKILSLYFAREIRQTIEKEISHVFLIGIESAAESVEEMELLRDEIQALAEKELIGADPVRSYIGRSRDESVALGLFKNCPALYSR